MDVLLGGLKSQDDFVNVFAKAAYSLLDFHYTGVDMAHTNKVFELVHRMAQYIHKAAVSTLQGPCIHNVRGTLEDLVAYYSELVTYIQSS